MPVLSGVQYLVKEVTLPNGEIKFGTQFLRIVPNFCGLSPIANTYPFHMLQRQANWTVDYLTDLELERVQEVYSQRQCQPTAGEC